MLLPSAVRSSAGQRVDEVFAAIIGRADLGEIALVEPERNPRDRVLARASSRLDATRPRRAPSNGRSESKPISNVVARRL
jgi:hypothetical protein